MNKVHAYLNTPIRYNPYQYLPLLKMRNNSDCNLLITDEVGLGKTIEAGIIIDDFLLNNNSKVLIICPAFLRDKWQQELIDKFYILSNIFSGKSKNELDERVVIVPMSKLRKFNEEYLKFCDKDMLIVVDEAHYYRNNHSARYRYLDEIMDYCFKSRLILLTATPVNNRPEDWSNIKRLLTKNYRSYEITNTTKLQAYINLNKRTVYDIWVNLSDDELGLYSEVDEKLEAFSGTIYRHIGAGCLYSLVKYAENNSCFSSDEIEGMYEYLDLENDYEFDDKHELAQFTLEKELPRNDTKLNKLIHLLNSHQNEKIVIFAHYIETVKYLADQIKLRYKLNHQDSQIIGYIYGNQVSDNIKIKNKKNKFIDVKHWFDEPTDHKILICSDACKEGVDLDSASVLVNYDLPFNPSVVEQRIGRIDRMSQKKDMTIYNFHVNDTYDDRLNAIINMKLRYISDIANYGIGNPLNISSNDAAIIVNKFIKYFVNRNYTNEDINIIKKVLTQVGVKVTKYNNKEVEKEILNSELKKLVIENKQKIIDWLSSNDDNTEKDILIQDYISLDEKLGFNKVDDEIVLKINTAMKEYIIHFFEESFDFYKIIPVLKSPSEYFDSIEEYGERKELSLNDIKDEIVINYKYPSLDDFIPYEIVESLVSMYGKR